jgi:hypothetical protein
VSDDDQEMMRITQRQGRCLNVLLGLFFLFFSRYPEFGFSIGLGSIFLSMSVGFFVSAIPKDAHRLAQLQLKGAFASLGFVFSFQFVRLFGIRQAPSRRQSALRGTRRQRKRWPLLMITNSAHGCWEGATS